MDGTECLLENKKDLCAVAGGGGAAEAPGPERTRVRQLAPFLTQDSWEPWAGKRLPTSGSEAGLPPTLCTFYLESGCSK